VLEGGIMTIGFDAKGLQHSYDSCFIHLMKETAKSKGVKLSEIGEKDEILCVRVALLATIEANNKKIELQLKERGLL
jgi:hypothetical protein